MYEDQDNDGKFPDETPVKVRYSHSSRKSKPTAAPGRGCRVPS
jgi:hypothetical protein